MPPTPRHAMRLAAVALGWGAAAGVMTACTAVQEPEEGEMDAMCEAVMEENPRVVSLADCGHVVNGLGRAVSLKLVFDSTKPVTPEQMDQIIGSVWAHVPFEPNSIRLTGRDAETKRVPVDLMTPTEQLDDTLRPGPFGFEGVYILDMEGRYGEWTGPN